MSSLVSMRASRAMRIAFGLLLLTCFCARASAECCKRKADFGCCGSSSGSCNVFCCNCGGCDKQCEYTECATFVWLGCSKIIGQCVSQCADQESGDCKSCMGQQHDSCKQCLVGADKLKSAEGSRKDDLEKDRVAFFHEVAGGKDIPLPTFMAYVKAARNLPGSGVDISKPGTISFEDAFKKIDDESDGDIGRREFDNDKLTIKLGDIVTDKQAPQSKAEPATTAASPSPSPSTSPPPSTAPAADDTVTPPEPQVDTKETPKQPLGFKGRKVNNPLDDPFFADDFGA